MPYHLAIALYYLQASFTRLRQMVLYTSLKKNASPFFKFFVFFQIFLSVFFSALTEQGECLYQQPLYLFLPAKNRTLTCLFHIINFQRTIYIYQNFHFTARVSFLVPPAHLPNFSLTLSPETTLPLSLQ